MPQSPAPAVVHTRVICNAQPESRQKRLRRPSRETRIRKGRPSAAGRRPPHGSGGYAARPYPKMNIARNASAATHMSGLTSRARPVTTMMRQYEMKPKPMPFVME